jgi:dihydropyrimidinase
MVHCENGDVVDHNIARLQAEGKIHPKYHAISRPSLVEAEATGRIIDLAYMSNAPLYIVHLTNEEALNKARMAAVHRKQRVLVETCPQYLMFDDSVYDQDGLEGAKFVMSPPIRKKKDNEVLWKGIETGSVDVVGTDHCPFFMEQKAMGKDDFAKIPNGAPGVENRIEVLFSEGVNKGRMSVSKLVDVCSTAPARIFGLFPQKGAIAPGFDADIVVFDPKQKHTLSASKQFTNCDYTMFEGLEVTGKVRQTILRGSLAIDEGKCLLEKGHGKFLQREKFNWNR